MDSCWKKLLDVKYREILFLIVVILQAAFVLCNSQANATADKGNDLTVSNTSNSKANAGTTTAAVSLCDIIFLCMSF